MLKRTVVISLLCLTLFSLVLSRTSNDLRVTLTNGSKLLGKYLRSNNGRPIKAFTNIPYAKPPLGSLRFKAPERIEKWDGEYKAINDGSICTQRDPFVRSFIDEGSEDCLYLNVYVPHTFGEEKLENLPVFAFFHGGGFVCGSGILPMYDPGYFLDHDVILVTANYRLGPLGFLSSENEHCPGNFGLKDQVMVLKWIQENIKRFGGDPKSVTIKGASAGGSSVTYLMMSPLADGLYSKAIAMSGTNLAPWSQPAHKGVATKRALQLAEHFNCHKPNDWTQTLDCLRNIPATNLTASFYDFYEFDTEPMVIFSPVVEPDLPGAFITKHPRDGQTESSYKTPLLTGVTFDEGLMRSSPILNVPGIFDEFVNNLDLALSTAFYYNHQDSSIQKSITKRIKQFYFDNNLTREKYLNMTNLFTDGWFLNAMDSYLRLRLAYKDAASTYVYLLTHKSSVSYSEIFYGDPETFHGISHADEKLYLFPVREKTFPHSLPTKEDEEIREAVMQLIVDFARTGNPTPASSHLPKWNEAKGFPVNYFRLGNLNFEGKPMFGTETGGIFEDRTKFWRKIVTLAYSNSQKDEL